MLNIVIFLMLFSLLNPDLFSRRRGTCLTLVVAVETFLGSFRLYKEIKPGAGRSFLLLSRTNAIFFIGVLIVDSARAPPIS